MLHNFIKRLSTSNHYNTQNIVYRIFMSVWQQKRSTTYDLCPFQLLQRHGYIINSLDVSPCIWQ
jgi:hypothetical protein